jgi:glycosyltransferase involved in cell wall biosynthesis
VLLLDVTHTSHTRAQTGIQRVCRSLAGELARRQPLQPICFDPHQQAWRILKTSERATLADSRGAAGSRRASWSIADQITGHIKRLTGRPGSVPDGEALICPELFSVEVARHLTPLFARVRGPRVALFHDAIGLKFPELTPPATVSRLASYLRELAAFDGVAAVSDDSALSLREFWRWAGIKITPPVATITLGVTPCNPTPPPTDQPPRVLCVGTLEARKNHLSLLEAAESLWSEGIDFELELIGMPRRDTGQLATARIHALQSNGRRLIYRGSVTDEKLHAAYQRCALTVYPSLYEGFGLPVIESLQHGRPCICGQGGALAETVRGGGVLSVEQPTSSALAAEMRRLLQFPAERDALTQAALRRKFRSWSDYVDERVDWMRQLRRRS